MKPKRKRTPNPKYSDTSPRQTRKSNKRKRTESNEETNNDTVQEVTQQDASTDKEVSQQSPAKGPVHTQSLPEVATKIAQDLSKVIADTISSHLSAAFQNITQHQSPGMQSLADTSEGSHQSPTLGSQSLAGPGEVQVHHEKITALPLEPVKVNAVEVAASPAQELSSTSKPGEVIPPSVHHYSTMSISLGVSPDVKKKIFQNEFIDFSILLNKSNNMSEYTIKINPRSPSNPLILTPMQHSRRITSLDQWLKAFLVFKVIHLEKFPTDAIPLTTYEANIKQLAAEGANWFFYDEQFRLLRQSTSLPWDYFHEELWLRSHMNFRQHQRKPGQPFQSIPVPKGYCYKYYRGSYCNFSQCHFNHDCPTCGNKHAMLKCRKSTNPSSRSQQNTKKPTASTTQASNTNSN